MRRRRWFITCLWIGFVCAPVVPAVAQNALDANAAVGSGGRNSRLARPDYRARNLLVTGNVVAGRGFRGTVGYTAANDFRDELGSNEFYLFRAGSAYSAPALIATGGTFEQRRYGQQLGLLEYRREGSGATLGTIREQRVFPRRFLIENRIRLDQYAAAATSSSLIEAGSQPDVVGILANQEGRAVAVSVSSVRGMQLEPVEIQYLTLGLTSFDMARVREDLLAGRAIDPLGGQFDTRFKDLPLGEARVESAMAEGRVEPQPTQLLIEPEREPDYQRILQRIAKRYAQRENTDVDVELSLLDQLDEQFRKLREQLLEAEAAAAPDTEATDEGDEGDEEQGEADPWDPNLRELMPSLRHGESLKQLASQDRTRFNELLAQAEQRLRDGEYFYAERRFRRALRYVPGHPLATAGMAHAQIGAGLYLPAALTLRRLLTNHPEMIDVQYDQSLLPNRVRLKTVIDALQSRLPEQRDRGLNAFVLAYIGHQLDDRSLVEAGLALMGEVRNDDPLLVVLRDVWLSGFEVPTELPQTPEK